MIHGVKQNKTKLSHQWQLDFRYHTRKGRVMVGQHFVSLYSVNMHAIPRTSLGWSTRKMHKHAFLLKLKNLEWKINAFLGLG
jgi:hypothetical protein